MRAVEEGEIQADKDDKNDNDAVENEVGGQTTGVSGCFGGLVE